MRRPVARGPVARGWHTVAKRRRAIAVWGAVVRWRVLRGLVACGVRVARLRVCRAIAARATSTTSRVTFTVCSVVAVRRVPRRRVACARRLEAGPVWRVLRAGRWVAAAWRRVATAVRRVAGLGRRATATALAIRVVGPLVWVLLGLRPAIRRATCVVATVLRVDGAVGTAVAARRRGVGHAPAAADAPAPCSPGHPGARLRAP
mmetsp:Transcript_85588/g.277194  ORF Transcript_85588/g.277194 Transcript_85588/m.277194 type:complete len:204 (-) Transcript_85588:7-618(-)